MAGGWTKTALYSRGQDLGGITSSSTGTTLTTGAANTKGSWIQLIATTANDISRLSLMIDTYGTSSNQVAVDIAVAASGSESSGIIIQNLVVQTSAPCHHVDLAVAIKAGSRVAARAAATSATNTPRLQIVGFDAGYTETLGAGLYDTYGYSGTGAISGVSVDPGATLNTKGSYAQITSSSTNDIVGFFLGFDYQDHLPGAGSDGHTLFDVAIGAAASEVVIVPNIALSKNMFTGGLQMAPSFTTTFSYPIKAGTRIAIRSQSASNTATDRLIGVSVYGMRS